METLKGLFYSFLDTIVDLRHLGTDTIVFVILLVITVIVVDGVLLLISNLRVTSGLNKKTKAVSVDGGKRIGAKNYVSDNQLLAGRPDAVIEEHGYLIPVEHKPLAKKIHDRYVAQLLVYMRLIEEFEGKKPPYGYLIIGPQCKRFIVENSPQRQAWLQKMLNEMQEVIGGAPCVATPLPKKCKKCEVRSHCSRALLEETSPRTIRSKSSMLARRVQ